MLRKCLALVALFCLVGAAPTAVSAQDTQQPLDARAFAREPALRSAHLSPDGRYVAAIQSVPQGDALIVMDWRTRQAQAIQIARQDRSLFLEDVDWKNDDRLIFVMRQRATMVYAPNDLREAEQFDVTRIFAVNRDGTALAQIFENQGNRMADKAVSVRLIDSLHDDPRHVLVGTWGQRGFTLYRADVGTGRVEPVEDADWQTFDLITDGTGYPVMRVDSLPFNSGTRIFRRAPGERRWTLAHEVRRTQRTQNRDFAPIGAGPGAGQVYVAARADGEEFQAIYLYNTATGELGQPVFRNEHADAAIAWINDDNQIIIGCGEERRWNCRALDPQVQRHIDGLRRYFEDKADFRLVNASADGQRWLVVANGPTIPPTFYVYDLATAQVSIVGSTQPQIPRARLAATRAVDYTARDGTHLWGYLTTPATGSGPYRTVIMPHGGPQSRDSFEYDFVVQFLAARGYAVFQPNFRGSEGSGRSFTEAGFHQWGRLMQDDITDGVRSLIDTGVADANKICIVGISYGGYAALAGASLTPDLYKCAVSIAGLSDLPELLDSERSDAGRSSALYSSVVEQVGDPNTDRDALVAASPRRHVDQIHVPILLVHGELDDVALVSQSQRMRDALQRAGKPVRYIEVPGVYHPWDGWTTYQAQRLLEEVDTFLGQNLPQ